MLTLRYHGERAFSIFRPNADLVLDELRMVRLLTIDGAIFVFSCVKAKTAIIRDVRWCSMCRAVVVAAPTTSVDQAFRWFATLAYPEHPRTPRAMACLANRLLPDTYPFAVRSDVAKALWSSLKAD